VPATFEATSLARKSAKRAKKPNPTWERHVVKRLQQFEHAAAQIPQRLPLFFNAESAPKRAITAEKPTKKVRPTETLKDGLSTAVA